MGCFLMLVHHNLLHACADRLRSELSHQSSCHLIAESHQGMLGTQTASTKLCHNLSISLPLCDIACATLQVKVLSKVACSMDDT